MNIEKWTRLAVLQERKKTLTEAENNIKSEIASLTEELLVEAMEEGVKRVTVEVGQDVDGMPVYRTVYIRRQVWAGRNEGVDAEQLADAMIEAGLDDYVKPTVNLKSLSAYVREHDPDSNLSPEELVERLPESLRKVVKVSEVYELRSVKA